MPSRFLNNININDEYSFPSTDGSADQIITTDGAGQLSFVDQSTISSGSSRTVSILVKNISSADGGVNLSKGDPVYVYGSVGASERLYVDLADAGDSSKMPCVALLDQDLSPNGEGTATVTGKLKNLITSPIDGATPTENDTIYVKSGGGLTLTKPTGSTNLIQNVGQVGRVSTSSDGNIVVSAILRSNDVPNLTTGKIWVGSTANTTESTVVHLDESNGRMGIGTPSPSSILHVVDGAPTLKLQSSVSSTSSTISFDNSLGTREGSLIHDTGNNTFRLKNESGLSRLNLDNYSATFSVGTSNLNQSGVILGATTVTLISNFSTALTCDYVGNVGIGTTNPSAKLEVNGDIALSGDNKVYSEGDTLTLMSGGTNGTYLVVDDISGNVGVGTNSPTQALDVNGNLRLGTTGDFYISQSPFTTSTFYIRTATSGTVAFGAPASFQQNVTAQGDIYAAGGSSSTAIGTKRFGNWSNKIVDTGNNYFNLQGGNFGIGTSSPSSKLQVNGDLTVGDDSTIGSWINVIAAGSNQDAGIRFGSETNTDSKAAIYTNTSNSDLHFDVTESTRMLIDSGTGNVGIGTSSPGSKLDVSGGDIRLSTNATYLRSKDSASAIPRVLGMNSANAFYVGPIDTYAGGPIVYGASSNLTYHGFYGGGSEKVRITSGGNVGIGTTSPSYKLDVNGEARFGFNGGIFLTDDSGTSYVRALSNHLNLRTTRDQDDIYFSTGTTTTTKMFIQGDTGNVGIGTTNPSPISSTITTLDIQGSTGGGLRFGVTEGVESTFYTLSTGSTTGAYAGSISSMPLHLITANTINATILANGNFGIGTSNPSEKLEVNGTVKATAATDAYKGYIKSVITTGYSMKSASTAYQYIPYNSYTLTTLQAYYNRTVAAYNGRVKKIIVKRIDGASADATGMKFKKEINGTVNATEYTATVLYGSGNFQATYNFANSDFTFSAGDSIGVLMQSSGGTGMIGAGAIQIVLEYNIT